MNTDVPNSRRAHWKNRSQLRQAARRRRRAALFMRLNLERLETRALLTADMGMAPEEAWTVVDEGPSQQHELHTSEMAYQAASLEVVEGDAVLGEVTLPDMDLDPMLEDSGPLIGLDQLRSDPRFAGINGDGYGGSQPIGVAIVDTGIDIDHPYLNYAGGYDLYHNDPNPNDGAGHGTHVAGIVGSTHGTYAGVAPGVNLYGVKVFADWGGSTSGLVIERGLQWVIDHAAANNIRVVNMSLGTQSNFRVGTTGGMDDEIRQLEQMGVTVVSASGNNWARFDPLPGQSYPGVNSTLGVGAVWSGNFGRFSWFSGARDYSSDTDRIVSFSQRDASNPNHVMAPGALITSTYRDGRFATFAGTSMASPHVAGLVALIQDAALEFGGHMLHVDQVVDIIRSTSISIHDGDDEDDNVSNTNVDYLRIDAYAALQAVYDMFSDIDVEAFPTPLQPELPPGSLIYDGSVAGRVNFVGDTDTFTLDVDAGQTITVHGDPSDELRAKIELYGPDDTLIASATSSDIGKDAVLQAVIAGEAGTHRVVISGVDVGGVPDFHAEQTQAGSVHYPNRLQFDFAGATAASSDGTLNVSALADLDGWWEYLTISAEGIYTERVFEQGGQQYAPVATSLTIPQSTLETLAADGTISFTVTPSNGVHRLPFYNVPNRLTLSLDYEGNPGGGTGEYEVKVLLNALMEATGSNDTLTDAQPLAPSFIPLEGAADRAAVVGSFAPIGERRGGLGRLFGYDFNTMKIHEFDRQTGASIGNFDSPLRMRIPRIGLAATPDSILVGGSRNEPLYELNPDTGAVIRSIRNPGIDIGGLAFLNGEIFASWRSQIYVIDYDSGAVSRTLRAFVYESLAASETKLYGTIGSNLYEFDPQNGERTRLTRLSSSNLIEGLGIIGNELYASSRYPRRLFIYDLDTFALKRQADVSWGALEALGADGGDAIPAVSDPGDYYSFDLQRGQFASLVATAGREGPVTTYTDQQTQENVVHYNNVLSYKFRGAPEPQGDAELKLDARADLRWSYEYLTIEAEGIFQEDVFITGGEFLRPVSTKLTIPESVIKQLAADGEVTFTVTPSRYVQNFGRSSLKLQMFYPTAAPTEVHVEVLDASGQVLAGGKTDADNVGEYIRDFQAPSDGTYYARVTGSDEATYSLVVTRGAGFSLERVEQSHEPAETVTFDFEEFVPAPKLQSSLTTTVGGVSATITHENGVLFDVDRLTNHFRYNQRFRFNSLSPFNGRRGAADPGGFIVDFSQPMSRVSVDMGDFGGDPDELSLVAYSGPGGSGDVVAQSIGRLPSGGNLFGYQTLSVQGDRIRSIKMIGGRGIWPNSVYYDNLVVTTAPELVPLPQELDDTGVVLGHVADSRPADSWLVSADFQGTFHTPRYMRGVEPDAADASAVFLEADTWNHLAQGLWTSVENPAFRGLVDSRGRQTGVDIEFTGRTFGWSHFAWWPVTDDVRGDYLVFNRRDASRSIDFRITGLEPNTTYQYYAYAGDSINYPGRRFQMVMDTDADGDFADETARMLLQGAGHLFASVASDANGVIRGRGLAAGPPGLAFEGNFAGFQLGRTLEPEMETDEYTFELLAGQAAQLWTQTPAAGPGEFNNQLDPNLVLVDPGGQGVANDDNGAADGRNARLEYQASTSGTHTVSIGAAAADAGEYVLSLNRTPVVTALSWDESTIFENDWATHHGTFVDQDLADTHQVVVDWDDPNVTADSTFALPATVGLSVGATFRSSTDDAVLTVTNVAGGEVSFTVSHQYLDDGGAPGNATGQDTSTVGVTVTDDDMTSGYADSQLVVENVAPEVGQVAIVDAGRREEKAVPGQQVAISGLFSDIGTLDHHTVLVDWGATAAPGDPADTSDSSNAADASISCDCDGGGTGSFTATHTYDTGGIYTVTVTVIDDDTGEAVHAGTEVFVSGVRVDVNTGQLQVVGTSGKDIVSARLIRGGSKGGSGVPQVKVVANLDVKGGSDRGSDSASDNGAEHFLFNPADITSIRMVLGGGNDHATIGHGYGEAGSDGGLEFAVPSLLEGDAGDDHLTGGAGPDVMLGGDGRDKLQGRDGDDVLLGEAGDDNLDGGRGNDAIDGGDDDDKLNGNEGMDLLIGGRGRDDAKGGGSDGSGGAANAGGDILVAGWTVYDQQPATLRTILDDAWVARHQSGDDYDDIVDGLVADWITPGTSVFDDGRRDSLHGGQKALDAFFADLDGAHGDDDRVQGSKGDRVIELDELLGP